MEKLSYEDLIKRFNEAGIKPALFQYNRLTDEQKLIVGQYTFVDQFGGDEGEGECVSWVMHLADHDLYVRIEGYYTSEDGTEWYDKFDLVTPRRVISLVYENSEQRGDKTDEA